MIIHTRHGSHLSFHTFLHIIPIIIENTITMQKQTIFVRSVTLIFLTLLPSNHLDLHYSQTLASYSRGPHYYVDYPGSKWTIYRITMMQRTADAIEDTIIGTIYSAILYAALHILSQCCCRSAILLFFFTIRYNNIGG